MSADATPTRGDATPGGARTNTTHLLDNGAVSALDTAPANTLGTPRTARTPWRSSYHVEILLASFSTLLIEISYTRIISFKLFYYYVYLVIGLALLGIGTGGVLVAVWKRLRDAGTDSILFWSLLLGSLTTIISYAIVARIQLDTLAVWRYGTFASIKSFALLILMCLCVFSSLVAPGVIIATLFGRKPGGIGGLYFADLFGGGLACATVIYLVSAVGAPATVMLAAATMAAGSVWVGLRANVLSWRAASVGVLAVALVLAIAPGLLPAQRVDTSKTPITASLTDYSSWGPVFRVDVSDPIGSPPMRLLFHDGILGSGIYRWDGTRAYLDRYGFPQDPRSLPFSMLGTAPSQAAIIGAAGGHEVLTSLYYGAKHIDAVELNPVTVHLVTTTYAGFDGHLAQNPAVHYVTGDGRSYIARSDKRYDLIWYPAPDSYAASNGALSSAYVLSESSLYTTNALVADLKHLDDRGLFVAQFGEVDDVHDLRTTRFVATARQALTDLGINDPANHILVVMNQTKFVANIPLSTIVVKRGAFTPQEIASFQTAARRIPDTSVLSGPIGPGVRPGPPRNPVNALIRTPKPQLGGFYSSYPFNVTPTTDNAPFFWHFARFGSVAANYSHSINSVNRENSVGERVLLLLLLVSIAISALFLLLPFFTIRSAWKRLPKKGLSAAFFGGVGFGFIFYEITLMQSLTLFLGYPTYSVTIVLMSLLLFTGVGAVLSQRVKNRQRAIPVLFLCVLGLSVFYLVGLSPVTGGLLAAPLGLRVAVAFLLLAPLGLCLGMFMPIGLGEIAKLGTAPRQYVAWGWAVNGFASVVGSALATILAMSFGFHAVLVLALVAYLLATAVWPFLGGRVRLQPL